MQDHTMTSSLSHHFFSFIVQFSVTALLVGEKLPPEAELDVSPIHSAPLSCSYLNQLDYVLIHLKHSHRMILLN